MDVNDYFKQLAISHKDILHTEDAPAYFREYSSAKILFGNSDFLTKMRYTKNIALISQFNKDGSYSGTDDDRFRKNNIGTIYLIKKVKANEVDDAFDSTYAVWQDIYTKMVKDEGDEVFGAINFKFRESYVHSLGMIADGFYGIAVFINYDDFQDGSCLIYDAEKWI